MLFSWEMAEAVFREALEDLTKVEIIFWVFLNKIIGLIFLKYLDE